MTVESIRLRRTVARIVPPRFLPSFVLAGYGLLVLSLFVRGVLSWYINPAYIPPTVLAGAALIALAVVGLRRERVTACEDGSTDSCCDEPAPNWRAYALLCLPLVLALLFPPRSLAAFSAQERGPQIGGLTAVRGVSAVKRVSLSVDTRTFTMSDWVGALSADPNPADYLHKPVIVSGLVLHDSASAPPGYFMVLRYIVTCCIADARPVGLIVKDTSHGAIKDNQWVDVTGTMGAASYQGQKIAVVEPTKITPTKSGNPYIY